MSSLWTPSGEHEVPRPGTGRTEGATQPRDAGKEPTRQPAATPAGAAAGASEEPSEEQLREVARQLAATPAEDVVANHCYGLFELAALHLSLQPPQLAQARLAIDALALLVEGLGERFGPHRADLSEGLNQIRLAFVRIADAAPPEGEAGSPQ